MPLKQRLPDILKKLKRGPAVVLPKDLGEIVAHTGIGKESRVVDAGAGTGFLAVFLGNICAEVTTYENDERFAKLAEENAKRAGLANVKVKRKSIFDGIEEDELDLVTLDLQNSHLAVGNSFQKLRKGGWLVGYCPNSEQVKNFYGECEKAGFVEMFALENMERELVVKDFGIRPEHTALVHTAYLVFAKK